jgi:hypothetical protein
MMQEAANASRNAGHEAGGPLLEGALANGIAATGGDWEMALISIENRAGCFAGQCVL